MFSRGVVNYSANSVICRDIVPCDIKNRLKNQPARLFVGTKLFLCHVCLFLGK